MTMTRALCLPLVFCASLALADDTAAPATPATPAVVTATVDAGTPAVTETATAVPTEKEVEKEIDDAIKPIDTNLTDEVSQIVALFKEGRWGPAIGALLMLIVWTLRRFIWKLIPKKVLPWLTFGLGMVVVVATELAMGVVWWKTLIDGLGTSGAAMAFWSLLFKHVLPTENKE